MASFNRFDICEAHYQIEYDYNVSGITQERASNRRRNMSTDFQLHRMGFTISPMFRGFESLSDNGKEIYSDLVDLYKLSTDSNEELIAWRDQEGMI